MAYNWGQGAGGAVGGAVAGGIGGSIVPGIGTAVGAGLGMVGGALAGFAGGGGGDGMTNLQRDLMPFQMQAFQAQQGLYNSQKRMLDIFSGGYEDLVPALSGLLQNKINANGLPADLARNIGQYYDQAGSKLGNYFSSRGTLNSGASQQAYQQLSQEEASKKLATILGQQREGINQSLSFMGQQPSVQPYGTSSLPTAGATASNQSQPLDLSGLGSIFARGFQGPTAAGGGQGSNFAMENLASTLGA